MLCLNLKKQLTYYTHYAKDIFLYPVDIYVKTMCLSQGKQLVHMHMYLEPQNQVQNYQTDYL